MQEIRLKWKYINKESIPHYLYIDRYYNEIDLYEYLRPSFSLKNQDNPTLLGECVLMDEGNLISFSIRIASLVLRRLSNFKIDYSCIYEFYNNPEFDLSSPIIYDNAPENFKNLRDEQYYYAKQILNKYSGLIQLPTGYGKNTMIAYFINKFRGSGNILIMAPISSILTEIKVRCKTYGIEVCTDFSSRVCMINPTAFMNSNKTESVLAKDWMSKVSMILIDESENINNSIRDVLEIYAINHKYIYGFSASAEKYLGTNLTQLDNLNKISLDTYTLLHYIGPGSVFKKSDKRMIISIAETKFKKEIYNPYWNNEKSFNHAMKLLLESDLPVEYVNHILPMTKGVLFVPVKSHKQGMNIYDKLINLGIKSCYWDAGTIITNIDIEEPLTDPSTLPPPKLKKNGEPKKIQTGLLDPKKINNSEELKLVINSGMIQVLISSQISYRGFDANNISDVMLMVGSQYNTVAQIAGRAERYGDDFTIWLLKPENEMECPINIACHYARLKHLKNSHDHIINRS